MKASVTLATVAVLALAAFASAQTVTVTLESSANGQTVQAGDTIDWTISVSVSADNEGLALISTDLVQADANPELFDVPVAASAPAEMDNFRRPAGITNPGETDPADGYTGMQRGAENAMNLVQIGGAQNTFGATLPAGTGMAQNANVVPDVGQPGPQIVAQGSFPAPATEGDYTFSLQNTIANVLTAINTPPDFSPVAAATIEGQDTATISFTVSAPPEGCKGDSNCDGNVNWRDIDFFVAAQNDNVSAWVALHLSVYGVEPTCPFANNDIGGPDGISTPDGTVSWRDIDGFVALQNTTCP